MERSIKTLLWNIESNRPYRLGLVFETEDDYDRAHRDQAAHWNVREADIVFIGLRVVKDRMRTSNREVTKEEMIEILKNEVLFVGH